jgi:hypothetical protein
MKYRSDFIGGGRLIPPLPSLLLWLLPLLLRLRRIDRLQKPPALVTEQIHMSAMNPAVVAHTQTAGLKRRRLTHVENPIDGKYSAIFPADGQGFNPAVLVMFSDHCDIFSSHNITSEQVFGFYYTGSTSRNQETEAGKYHHSPMPCMIATNHINHTLYQLA